MKDISLNKYYIIRTHYFNSDIEKHWEFNGYLLESEHTNLSPILDYLTTGQPQRDLELFIKKMPSMQSYEIEKRFILNEVGVNIGFTAHGVEVKKIKKFLKEYNE